MTPDVLQFGALGLALAIAWKGMDFVAKLMENRASTLTPRPGNGGRPQSLEGTIIYDVSRTLSELSNDNKVLLSKMDELISVTRAVAEKPQ
tara:strand:- start:256 stop:528 length:273 start_codon:yes stop_codon:yes gene_type:complete